MILLQASNLTTLRLGTSSIPHEIMHSMSYITRFNYLLVELCLDGKKTCGKFDKRQCKQTPTCNYFWTDGVKWEDSI